MRRCRRFICGLRNLASSVIYRMIKQHPTSIVAYIHVLYISLAWASMLLILGRWAMREPRKRDK